MNAEKEFNKWVTNYNKGRNFITKFTPTELERQLYIMGYNQGALDATDECLNYINTRKWTPSHK